MINPTIALIDFNDIDLHPLIDETYEWLLSMQETCKAFETSQEHILEIKDEHDKTLVENRHFIISSVKVAGYESSEQFLWTKKGLMRLAYYLNSDSALLFLDFMEELNFEIETKESQDDEIPLLYKELETTLMQKLQTLKNDDSSSLNELNQLISTVGNLVQKKAALKYANVKKGASTLETILSTVSTLMQSQPSNMAQNSEFISGRENPFNMNKDEFIKKKD